MRTGVICALGFLVGAIPLAATSDAPQDATAPKIVAFEELKSFLKAQKGKVVVADCWTDT